jgi:2-oxoglutarate dehydrogenase complex dehydrogenase (E1) component-like enzyme
MSGEIVAASIAAVSATAAMVATVSNIIYQARQFRVQRELLQRQAELYGLQADDLRGSSTERRMQQAASVRLDNWTSRLVPKTGVEFKHVPGLFSRKSDTAAVISSVRVCNDSNGPIRDIQVRFDSEDARWARLLDDTLLLPAPLNGLGPASSAWFDSDYQNSYTGMVILRFTDADGNHWQSDILGDIKKVEAREW